MTHDHQHDAHHYAVAVESVARAYEDQIGREKPKTHKRNRVTTEDVCRLAMEYMDAGKLTSNDERRAVCETLRAVADLLDECESRPRDTDGKVLYPGEMVCVLVPDYYTHNGVRVPGFEAVGSFVGTDEQGNVVVEVTTTYAGTKTTITCGIGAAIRHWRPKDDTKVNAD